MEKILTVFHWLNSRKSWTTNAVEQLYNHNDFAIVMIVSLMITLSRSADRYLQWISRLILRKSFRDKFACNGQCLLVTRDPYTQINYLKTLQIFQAEPAYWTNVRLRALHTCGQFYIGPWSVGHAPGTRRDAFASPNGIDDFGCLRW
jgi:hypothetical protein